MDNKKIVRRNKSQFVVAWFCFVIVLISVSVFIGTWHNITLLVSVLTPWVSIKINAALCFLIAGFIIYYLSSNYRNYFANIIFFVLTGFILLISSLTIIEYFSGIDFGYDQLFFKNSLQWYHQGRMPLVTAINFMLMALSFILLLKKTKLTLTIKVLAGSILLLSFVSVFNYLYSSDPTYVYAQYTTMSMQSMFLFLLISTCIFLLGHDSEISEVLLGKKDRNYFV